MSENRELSSRIFYDIKVFWILGICLVIALLAMCIIQLNDFTKETYLIHRYENTISSASLNNKDAEINLSKSQSLNGIESKVNGLNLEKISQIKYIKTTEGELAKTTQTSRP